MNIPDTFWIGLLTTNASTLVVTAATALRRRGYEAASLCVVTVGAITGTAGIVLMFASLLCGWR